MKTRMFAALALALLVQPGIANAAGRGLSPEDKQMLVYYGEADHLAQFAQNMAWPGFKWDHVPFVIFDPNRVAFQLNSDSPLPGFKRLTDAPAKGAHPIFVRYGSTADLASKDIYATVGGRKVAASPFTMLKTLLPNGFSPASYFAIPLAIRLQETFPWNVEYKAKGPEWLSHYPVTDAENFALAEIEGACLKAAFSARTPEDTQKYAKWFVAVRTTRQARLEPVVARYENNREAFQATARYATAVVMMAGSNPAYKPTSAFKTLVGPGFHYPNQSEMMQWFSTFFDQPFDERFVRMERLNVTGMTQEVILDKLQDMTWHGKLARTGNVTTAVAEAVKYDPKAQVALTVDAKVAFDYDTRLGGAKKRLDHTVERMDQFNNQQGYLVKVHLPAIRHVPPKGPRIGVSWSPQAFVPLEFDDRTWLFTGIHSFDYDHPNVQLHLKDMPAKFYSTDMRWRFQNALVRMPLEKGQMKLDGKAFDLHPGIYKVSKNLTIQTAKATITVTKGSVRVGPTDIEIMPTN